MADTLLPPPVWPESADSGENTSPSSVVEDSEDIKFQPTVKMEFGDTEFITQGVGTVSASGECSESDALEWTPPDVKWHENELKRSPSFVVQSNIDIKFQPRVKIEVMKTEFISQMVGSVSAPEECSGSDPLEWTPSEGKCQEEHVPGSPSSPDFMGFSTTDLDRARDAVHSNVEALRSYMAELQTTQAAAPSSQERRGRRRAVVCYREEEDLDGDITGDVTGAFCDECDCEWAECCPLHGPMNIIPDTKVLSGTGDAGRCVNTLPECLSSGRSNITVANTGVLAEKDLTARQRFGPFEGAITTGGRPAKTIGYSWKVRKSDRVDHYVNAGDLSSSNWLRLVNCARTEEEQNMVAFQYKGHIYYRTCKPIRRGSELLVCFGDEYMGELDIDVQPPTKTKKAPAATQAGPSSSDAGATDPCLRCDYKCLGQLCLDKHKKNRHGDVGRSGIHKCERCPYSTDNAVHLVCHQSTHTRRQLHRCDVCGKTFRWQSVLICHLRVHSGERPYVCDVCGKAFSHSNTMVRHRRIHTEERPYRCDVCGKTFSQPSDLKRHHRVHNGQRPYECDVCGKAFGHRSNLTSHHRIHTGQRPYECDVCGKTFVVRSHLTSHHRIHTGQRPYECDVCGKAFVQRIHLTSHHSQHTGQKPYQCNVCGKAFGDRSNLISHHRIHTGQRPYECDVCEKAFGDRSNLNRHRRVHTS